MKKAFIRFVVLFCLLMMGACVSYSSEDLRSNPYETGSFLVPLPLKTTMQNIVDRVSQCYVYGNQYASLNVIEMAVEQYYVVEVSNWVYATQVGLSIDVQKKGKDTEVTFFKKSGFGGATNLFHNFRERLVHFANDSGEYCSHW